MELLLELVKSFVKTVEPYDLSTLLGGVEVYDNFKQCLQGNAYDTWDSVFVDADNTTWETKLANHLDILINHDAYSIQ